MAGNYEHGTPGVLNDCGRDAPEQGRLDSREATSADHDRLGVDVVSDSQIPPACRQPSAAPRRAFRDRSLQVTTVLGGSVRSTQRAEASFDKGAVRPVAGSYGLPHRHWLPHSQDDRFARPDNSARARDRSGSALRAVIAKETGPAQLGATFSDMSELRAAAALPGGDTPVGTRTRHGYRRERALRR